MSPLHAVAPCAEDTHQLLVSGLRWHGTLAELLELNLIVEYNCPSIDPGHRANWERCTTHSIAYSQRMLDGLLWARRTLELRMCEEYLF